MDIDGLAIAGDSRKDWFRNIVSLRQSIHVWADIADDSETHDDIVALDSLFKPYSEPRPIVSRPFEEVETVAPIADAIGYPFERFSSTRFSAGQYGVWYGAGGLETSIYETGYHFRRYEMTMADERRMPVVTQERRVHLVACNATLIDLRPHVVAHPELLSNDYAACQALGAELHASGYPGVVSVSARDKNGEVAAVFARDKLGDDRVYCFLTYRLDLGTGVVTVEREPGNVFLEIHP